MFIRQSNWYIRVKLWPFDNLESWSKVVKFIFGNKSIPDGLGANMTIAVGQGFRNNRGEDVTVNSYLGGGFSKGTGMYVDPYDQSKMTLVLNIDGGLEAPIFFKGNVWDVLNTGVHENNHRSLGPINVQTTNAAIVELRAIKAQRAHASWGHVSDDYKKAIQNYENTNKALLKGN